MIFTITRISTAMDGGGFIQARDLRLSQIHPNHQSIRQGFNRIEPRGFNCRAETEENTDGYGHGKCNNRTANIRAKDHLEVVRLKDGLYQKHAKPSAKQHTEYPARQTQRRGLN